MNRCFHLDFFQAIIILLFNIVETKKILNRSQLV